MKSMKSTLRLMKSMKSKEVDEVCCHLSSVIGDD